MRDPNLTVCRAMVSGVFTREKIEELRPSIQKLVDDCIENMRTGGCKEPVDLVEKFALLVPSEVRMFTLFFPLGGQVCPLVPSEVRKFAF
jgi:cytochrome P450